MIYPGLENFSWHKGIFEGWEIKLVIFSLFDITNVGDIVGHKAHCTQQCHAFLFMNGYTPWLGFEVMLNVSIGWLPQVAFHSQFLWIILLLLKTEMSPRKHRCIFNKQLQKEFTLITKTSVSDSHLRCNTYSSSFSISHSERGDIKTHLNGDKHKTAISAAAASS